MAGTFTKNLLLKDKRGRLFLIVAEEGRSIDLRTLHAKIGARVGLVLRPLKPYGKFLGSSLEHSLRSLSCKMRTMRPLLCSMRK
jgi:hypothetical protein